MSFQRILIAVDGSAAGERAADVGLGLARSLSAEVAFIHVIDPALTATADSGIPSATMFSILERDAQAMLAALGQRADLTPPPVAFLRTGIPSREILAIATEWNADLLVVGTHGHSGLLHLLMGSVAQAVVHHASCPVLLVRPAS